MPDEGYFAAITNEAGSPPSAMGSVAMSNDHVNWVVTRRHDVVRDGLMRLERPMKQALFEFTRNMIDHLETRRPSSSKAPSSSKYRLQ
jgi:hypothetical protein